MIFKLTISFLFIFCLIASADITSVNTTYLWHMHQPIYWPKSTTGSGNGYEKALDTINNSGGRGGHPTENLGDIFGKDDRKASYQYRLKESVASMSGQPDAGSQVTMSGSLMQNIDQLGDNNAYGYSPSWTANGQGRTWKTSDNKPRLDLICIPSHHPIAPFAHPRTLEIEVQIHEYLTQLHYGSGEPYTKGFFPPEMCFSERIIPTLVKGGFNWVAVADNHISRACPNFPYVTGSGGELCDPPNKADQINPNGANWFRKQIDRGCSPCNAIPFAVQPHYARQYDPHTGEEYKIIVVPAEMALSWDDGYSAMGTDQIDANIAPYNNSSKPSLVMLCHDGDNAWGGGASYYQEAVPGFTSAAVSKGYHPTTVEQYLNDFPVAPDDIVHVEDGGWVNADGDFGSPFMLNWTWFLWKNDKVDIEDGWHYKLRDYAIRMAALNWVLEAEKVVGEGNIDVAKVAEPYSGASSAEKAWHFYLGSLDSGFQYYGNPGDNEIRVSIACNEAYHNAQTAVGSNSDSVGPSVWVPQRFPWNPGGQGFGPYNWGEHGTWGPVDMGKDFYVWTFAYDRSGISSIKVIYRTDKDGVNSTASNHNEIFAGGSDVNSWQDQAMTDRGEFPKTMDGFSGLENIEYELPEIIAHHYWSKLMTSTNTLYDYAIVAIDAAGHSTTSDIQHVFVGSTSSGSGGDDVVSYNPETPVRGGTCTITYNSSGRNLSDANPVYIHLGYNNWDGGSLGDFAMTGTVGGTWSYTFFVSNNWTQIDSVFNNGSSTWDNNNGQDWHESTIAGDQPPSVSFNGYPQYGDAPLTVIFSDISGGVVDWRLWDFGDGNTSSEQTPDNVYTSAGSYTVTLIVSNSYGASTNTQTDYITVTTPGAPQANFSASPLHGPPGTVVQFTDQSGGAVSNWSWDFGDSGTSSQQSPSHQYSSSGIFTVQLIVSGPVGISTNTKTGYITISDEYQSTIDGTNILVDFTGALKVFQDTPTGFGDAVTPGVGGSELDGLFVTNDYYTIRIGLSGNLELNGNCMMLFIDSKDGGINEFTDSMTFTTPKLPNMVGVKFDSEFLPDYAVIPNTYGGGHYVDFEQLVGTEKDGYYGQGEGDIFISRILVNENNGFTYGFNNSNVGGVTTGSVSQASSVSTGWEMEIPFELIDVELPASGIIKVQVIITSPMSASSKWISNQSLPGINNASGIQGEAGTGNAGDYTTASGNQYLSYEYDVIPEPVAIYYLSFIIYYLSMRKFKSLI